MYMSIFWIYWGKNTSESTSTWLHSSGLDLRPIEEQLLFALDYVASTPNQLAVGIIQVSTTSEIIISIMMMYFTLFLKTKCIGEVLPWLSTVMKANYGEMGQIRNSQAVLMKNLPLNQRSRQSLRQLFYRYYTFNKELHGGSSFNLLLQLPWHMRHDLVFECCKDIMRAIPQWANMPQGLLHGLVLLLHPQIAIPDEVLIHPNLPSGKLFLLHCGRVKHRRTDRSVILKDGSHFGYRSFIKHKHPADVYSVALRATQLFVLEYKDFVGQLAYFPQLDKNIKTRGNSFTSIKRTVLGQELSQSGLEKTNLLIESSETDAQSSAKAHGLTGLTEKLVSQSTFQKDQEEVTTNLLPSLSRMGSKKDEKEKEKEKEGEVNNVYLSFFFLYFVTYLLKFFHHIIHMYSTVFSLALGFCFELR